MNLWKLLIKQIKAHPIATIFLIFGYIISIIQVRWCIVQEAKVIW